MDKAYLEQMRIHVDEGGKLTHQNATDLLAEIERLREALKKSEKKYTELHTLLQTVY